MKFIFLNAPPRSGKDTAADYLSHFMIRTFPVKFASPLYNSVREVFGLTKDEWNLLYNHHKEDCLEQLRGMSPRQAMIWMSEDVIKPKFGSDFFGHAMVNRLRNISDDAIVIASDSGFHSEAVPVMDFVGAENCFHVTIERDGCDFSNDSRSLWGDNRLGNRYHTISNNGTKDEFYRELKTLMNDQIL